MRIDVLSLFPEMITSYCNQSILKLAQEKKLLDINAHNPRDFSLDKHKKVDDTPYGGGAGMLLSPQPFYDCFKSVIENGAIDLNQSAVIMTCPSGQVFNQALAKELAQKKNLVFLCGRYEGFDERLRTLANYEISMGDFVTTGGELPALTIIDTVSRFIPGVLGADESSEIESFSEIDYQAEFKKLGVTKRELSEFLTRCKIRDLKQISNIPLLEFPQYTRPKEFKGAIVPEILQSGDHKKIFLWRLEQSIKKTRSKRPDLFKKIDISRH